MRRLTANQIPYSTMTKFIVDGSARGGELH